MCTRSETGEICENRVFGFWAGERGVYHGKNDKMVKIALIVCACGWVEGCVPPMKMVKIVKMVRACYLGDRCVPL